MTRASMGKKMEAKSEYWRERITEQERSGMSVQRFCQEQGLTEQSFYLWRKRLRKQQPMRFALVETGPARQPLARRQHQFQIRLRRTLLPRRSRIWNWCWRRASGCESALA